MDFLNLSSSLDLVQMRRKKKVIFISKTVLRIKYLVIEKYELNVLILQPALREYLVFGNHEGCKNI